MPRENLLLPLAGRGEKLLAENLSEGERVLVKLPGNFGQALVMTNRRLYIVKWGFQAKATFGGKCIAYEYRNITALEVHKHMVTRLVQILTPATQANNKLSYWGGRDSQNNAVASDSAVTYDKKYDALFQEAVNIGRRVIAKSNQHSGMDQSVPDNDIEQLERLSVLKEKGILTNAEFLAKKKQILGQ